MWDEVVVSVKKHHATLRTLWAFNQANEYHFDGANSIETTNH